MKCPDRGVDIPESADKCSCGFEFRSGAELADATITVEASLKRRNPIWAGVLSLLTSGLGQIYNGQVLKGVIFYLAGYLVLVVLSLSGLAFTFWGLIIFVVAPIILYVAIIAEAAFTSHKLGSIVLQRYNRWYVYLLLIICTGLINAYVWSPAIKLVAGVRSYRMPASSMEPTLKVGDHFIARTDYDTRNKPKQSEIVVFRYPEDHSKDFIKRVVAHEGQKIEIRDKKVFVDDQEVAEPWAVHRSPETTPATQSPRDNLGPIIVPKGHVFVMGDNRDFSLDSRFFGPVDVREIKGRALHIYWADEISRIGTSLQ